MTSTQPYPYLFQTSGFARIDSIRAELESQSEWDYASNRMESGLHVYKAGYRFGFRPPYSDEQHALINILVHKSAGLHISTYAWGLYAEMIRGGLESPQIFRKSA